MNTKHFAVYNGGQREEIEDLATGFPYGSIAILGLTFLVEPVDLGDLSRLMVSPDQRDSVRESVRLVNV